MPNNISSQHQAWRRRRAEKEFQINPILWATIPCRNDEMLALRRAYLCGAEAEFEVARLVGQVDFCEQMAKECEMYKFSAYEEWAAVWRKRRVEIEERLAALLSAGEEG